MNATAEHDLRFSRMLADYLRKRSLIRPFAAFPEPGLSFRRAVVIPALAESQDLPRTLDALAANPAAMLEHTLVVIVVNNRPMPTASPILTAEWQQAAADNQLTLKWLAKYRGQSRLHLAWIDAASPGLELPEKSGVGLARKIGVDSVLAQLAAQPQLEEDFVFFSLDADTLVRPDYLESGTTGLRHRNVSGGIFEFHHQPAATPALQTAIDDYELFLHYYVRGLRYAGSPYAFHAIGSCLVFTAMGYIRAGGFPARRQAGEDFYFCQELVKTGGLCELRNTVVSPSSRLSGRVPFGTGPQLVKAMAEKKPLPTYDPRVFTAVREWLAAVKNGPLDRATEILGTLTVPETVEFLVARDFPTVWNQFQLQYKNPGAIQAALHRWFDGFVTLKLIHRLSERKWPRIPLPEALANAANLFPAD